MSVEIATKRFSAIAASIGKFSALEQFEKNLAGGGRGRIDVNKIAIARIARMMIDVDPEFRAARPRRRLCPGGFASRCRARWRHRNLRGSLGGLVNNSAPRQKEYFSSMPSSFQTVTSLPSCLQRKAERELTAERVAVGPDMAENREASDARARRATDFRESWRLRSLRSSLRGRFDFLQDLDDACAAFDRIIEMKNEMRRVFQNDVFRQLGLQSGAVRFEFGSSRPPASVAENADEDMRVLQVGGDIHLVHGHEARFEIDFARDDALSSRFSSSFTRSSRCFM